MPLASMFRLWLACQCGAIRIADVGNEQDELGDGFQRFEPGGSHESEDVDAVCQVVDEPRVA